MEYILLMVDFSVIIPVIIMKFYFTMKKKSEYEEYRNFITTDYTDLASSKEMTLEEIKAAEKVMENLQKSEANTYDNLRSQMKKEEEKKKESGKKIDPDASNIYYYQKK